MFDLIDGYWKMAAPYVKPGILYLMLVGAFTWLVMIAMQKIKEGRQ
jgi:hypothetical protein